MDYQRYILTDLLEDLRGCTDPVERVHLVAHMLQRTSELALLAGGHWLGKGKWLSRRLADADLDFAAAVAQALDQAGGPLWDGYTIR